VCMIRAAIWFSMWRRGNGEFLQTQWMACFGFSIGDRWAMEVINKGVVDSD
jgi:hypothetical protein